MTTLSLSSETYLIYHQIQLILNVSLVALIIGCVRCTYIVPLEQDPKLCSPCLCLCLLQCSSRSLSTALWSSRSRSKEEEEARSPVRTVGSRAKERHSESRTNTSISSVLPVKVQFSSLSPFCTVRSNPKPRL